MEEKQTIVNDDAKYYMEELVISGNTETSIIRFIKVTTIWNNEYEEMWNWIVGRWCKVDSRLNSGVIDYVQMEITYKEIMDCIERTQKEQRFNARKRASYVRNGVQGNTDS